MKVLTYILTFTVVFLSVKPAIDTFPLSSESQQTCCSSSTCIPISDNDNSRDQNNDRDGKSCNPFQTLWFLFITLHIVFISAIVEPSDFNRRIFRISIIYTFSIHF